MYVRDHQLDFVVVFCFSFLFGNDQIKLVNINPSDIIEGKPSVVLGLIWTIILYFQVSSVQSIFLFLLFKSFTITCLFVPRHSRNLTFLNTFIRKLICDGHEAYQVTQHSLCTLTFYFPKNFSPIYFVCFKFFSGIVWNFR